ncbi:MAG: hypothetical protein E6929_13780 [Clostridium sp.]|nr:hypothetical protein [Clostridium sp.]
MIEILKLLKPYRSVSIIGMNKNVGKTTTLNYILKEARGKVSLGLTSIGRDGEEIDVVTSTEKPKIYIEKNAMVATAKACLLNSDFTREIVETTDINTPMGEIVIARALSDGYVDLGGPSVNNYMSQIRDKLLKYNCDLVIIDGALNRKTFASPAITEATVLSTGAALNRSMNEVVKETIHSIELLSLPKVEDLCINKVSREILSCGNIGVIYKDNTYRVLDAVTALNSSRIVVEALDDNVSCLVIKGVISDTLIKEIMASTVLYRDITIVAEDGTKLFINGDTYYKFTKQGGEIQVLNKINIVCVTTNPKAPYGYEFSPKEFVDRLRDLTDIPVFDVLGGE